MRRSLILYATLPVLLGLVSSLAADTVKPDDAWKPWLWAATALLAVSTVVVTVNRESVKGEAVTGAPPGKDLPAPRAVDGARLRGVYAILAASFLALGIALCVYILAARRDPVWDVWTKLDYAAAPVAACFVMVAVLLRRRWSFAATVMVPVLIVGWPTTVWYFEPVGAASLFFNIGCSAAVLWALYAQHRKRAVAVRHDGAALVSLASLAIFAVVIAALVSEGHGFVAYLPMVIAFACVVTQAGWERDHATRLDASRATIVFAVLQAGFSVYLLGTAVLPEGTSPPVASLALLISLVALLIAGVLIRAVRPSTSSS